MCDARTETERLLAEQRDRARIDRDRAEAHLDAARQCIGELRAAGGEALRWVECVGDDPFEAGCECDGCQARYALATVLYKPDAGCGGAVELSEDEFDSFMGHVREAAGRPEGKP